VVAEQRGPEGVYSHTVQLLASCALTDPIC
jgi:hypothetical protein